MIVSIYKDAGKTYYYVESLSTISMFYFHREDGPAIERLDGSKEWYQNDKRHRIDGPAIEYANGTKYWYQNGKCHREDGPAIEWANGEKTWFIEDKYIKCNSQEEFERLLKLKAFW